MSRVDAKAAKTAETLQGKLLFGEIPTLKGVQNKPQRLTDQIDLIKEKAYQDGYKAGMDNGMRTGIAEGRKAGLEMALSDARSQRNKEAAQFFEDWEHLRADLDKAIEGWFAQAEETLTHMSMEVVRRILATELETNHMVALSICKDVLQLVTHAKQARILINPSDYALFESHRDELAMLSRDLKGIEIVQDHTITSGVMVETEAGIIDATVDTRLSLIQEEFDQAA
ncbi:MAG: hypothetical protein JST12_03450 [Armatimonadetes bacterium]|nr:hypothetical protein [Armatimonadota bacterium]